MATLRSISPEWMVIDEVDFDLGKEDFSIEAWYNVPLDKWSIHKFNKLETEWDD